MQDDETTTAKKAEHVTDGSQSAPEAEADRARVEFLKEEPQAGAAAGAPAVDLKAKIAGRIRTDGKEQRILTSEDAIIGLVPGLRHDTVSAALAEMAKDPGYGDIKGVTTASGLVFFYSERHIKVAEAAAKSLLEEVKFRIGERVRADSRDGDILTPVDALYAEIGWDTGSANPHEIHLDERYADIKTVTASTGDVYFYSDRHMSGYYALLLARVAAHDPCAVIAETVRDESRIYPRPTCIRLFLERLFGIAPGDLEALVDATLKRPEFADIKKMVHPATGGVYLYSSQYINEEAAWAKMDWEEVGRDANP